VDGSYTNRTVLRQLPERTVASGRIRADAKLYDLPGPSTGKGRNRVYGTPLATLEAIRQDPAIPWTRADTPTACVHDRN
jgi:hypothetical protein